MIVAHLINRKKVIKKFRTCHSPKLDADQELSDDNGDHNPALPAKLVTLGIVQQFKSFTESNLDRVEAQQATT